MMSKLPETMYIVRKAVPVSNVVGHSVIGDIPVQFSEGGPAAFLLLFAKKEDAMAFTDGNESIITEINLTAL